MLDTWLDKAGSLRHAWWRVLIKVFTVLAPLKVLAGLVQPEVLAALALLGETATPVPLMAS